MLEKKTLPFALFSILKSISLYAISRGNQGTLPTVSCQSKEISSIKLLRHFKFILFFYLIFLTLFLSCMFQVSFFSTSPELSNKQRFEYFTRTIPSDHYQVKAMVDIVRKMNWSYVSIIYEESNYGIKVANKFINHNNKRANNNYINY